jgi:hypothetical protein
MSQEKRFHGTSLMSGEVDSQGSISPQGPYGYMFRRSTYAHSVADLKLLAETMIETDFDVTDRDARSNTATIPAGFTYLGQFIDHDLTFDRTSSLTKPNIPSKIQNWRTPKFDLDSVYGGGPAMSPELYCADQFRIVPNNFGVPELPRSGDGRAILSDPRNDENQIISQLHLAFLRFHNKVHAEINDFEKARTCVQWHYQWIVLHQFLPTVVNPRLLSEILSDKPASPGTYFDIARFPFAETGDAFIPVEFSVGAYRFGHSMIRQRYNLRGGDGGPRIFDSNQESLAGDLRGFRPIESKRAIQWFRFFNIAWKEGDLQSGEDEKVVLQTARAIDTLIANSLGNLPHEVTDALDPRQVRNKRIGSLPLRSMIRAEQYGLLSAQEIANELKIPEAYILRPDKNARYRFEIGCNYPPLSSGIRDRTLPPIVNPKCKKQLEEIFGERTPLFYYVLKEAELIENGRRLGPLGGCIVAGVFINLLRKDKNSFLNVDPSWRPKNGKFGAVGGDFKIENLIEFVSSPVQN